MCTLLINKIQCIPYFEFCFYLYSKFTLHDGNGKGIGFYLFEDGLIAVYCPSFTPFTPKLSPLCLRGHELNNSGSPYPTDAIYQVWFRPAP